MSINYSNRTQQQQPLQGFVLSVALTEAEARKAGTSLEKIVHALRVQLAATLPAASTDHTFLVAHPAGQAPRAQARPRLAVTRRGAAESGLVIDLPRAQARVDGRDISLSQREFCLLRALIEAQSKPVGRPALFTQVWGHLDDAGSENPRVVDVTVRRLRSRLGRYGQTIRTVRGLGYRFDPVSSVTVNSAPAAAHRAS